MLDYFREKLMILRASMTIYLNILLYYIKYKVFKMLTITIAEEQFDFWILRQIQSFRKVCIGNTEKSQLFVKIWKALNILIWWSAWAFDKMPDLTIKLW